MYGFTSERGTGTAIVEAKLQQEFANIRQEPLFQVYLNLKKAYDTLDRPRALETLKNYGMGTRLRTLLHQYWQQQQIVARQSGFHGPAFIATRGGTQGGLFTPTLFNICVDNVIRYWLSLVVEDNQIISQGFGDTVDSRLALFYADDGLLSTTQTPWLQQALDILKSGCSSIRCCMVLVQ
jgi:Reverse transcriptase (RNA-dependent DNA polymerase)